MKIVHDSYILLLLLALFIGLVLIIRVWRHRNMPIIKTLIVLMAALVFWLAAAIMGHIITGLSGKIFWMQMAFVGKLTMPVAWLVFTLQFTERKKWLTGRNVVLASILPAITLIIVWTNNLHHLMWKDVWLNLTVFPPAIAVTYNIWFLVNIVYLYSLIFLGTLLLLISFRQSLGFYLKPLGIMLFAVFLPWICHFLFISGIWSISVLDPTPLAFVFTGVVLSGGLSRFHLLDTLPIAQDAICHSMIDGVVIVDTQNRIVEINPAAQSIIKNDRNNIIGKPCREVLPGEISDFVVKCETDNFVTEIELGEATKLRHYTINLSPIFTGQRIGGYIILLHDDTERRQAEDESRKRAILEIELSERTRANEELKQSEYKFRELFNNIGTCVMVYESRDHGTNFIIKDLNKAAENIEEVRKDELQGKLVTEVFPGVIESGLLSVLQRVWRTGNPEYLPLTFYKDRRISGWREYYIYKLPTGEIIAAYEDVTMHKQSEDLLNQTLHMFEGVANSSPIGLYIVQEGKFRYINPRFEAITGFGKEEIIGSDSVKYIHPEDKDLVTKNATRDLKSVHSYSIKPYQYRIICKSGETRWILETVASIQYLGMRATLGNFMDITELKRAEEQVRISEDQIRFQAQVLDAQMDAVFVHDEAGKILYTNRSAQISTGYTGDELAEMNIRQLDAKEIGGQVPERKSHLDKYGYNTFESIHQRIDGAAFPVEIHSTATEWREQKIILSVARDITGHKKFESKLKENEERFRMLAENARDIIFYYALRPKPHFEYISSSVAEITGYSPDEFYADTQLFTKMTVSGDFSVIEKDITRAIIDKKTFTLHGINKYDKSLWLELKFHPSFDVSGNLVAVEGVARDVTERKHSELSLIESEAKFRSLAEQSPNMIFINKGGKVVYANKKCEEVTGYSREDFYSPDFNFMDLVAPDSKDFVMECFDLHSKNIDIPPYEYKVIAKDGKQIDCINSTNLIDYGGSKAILGVVTDITARKKAEKDLRFQSQLLDATTDSILVLDRKGKVVYFNEATYKTRGYTREEMVGKQLNDLVSSNLLSSFSSIVNKLLEKKGEATFDSLERRKDGSMLQVEVHNSLIKIGDEEFIVNVSRDITERKKHEIEKEQGARFLQVLIDSIPLPVFYKNADGVYLGCNDYYARFFGIKKEDFIGKDVYQINPEQVADTYNEKDRELLENPGTQIHESKLKDGEGKSRNVVFHKATYHNLDGSVSGIVGAILDITEIKQVEKTLRENEERLKEAQSLGRIANYEVEQDTLHVIWSEQMYELFERDKSLPPPDTEEISSYFSAEEFAKFMEITNYTIKEGKESQQDIIARLPSGSEPVFHIIVRPVMDGNGRVIKTFGIIQDVTESKQAEKKIIQAAEEWRRTFDSINEMVCILDNDYRLLRVNKAFANTFHKNPRELLGKHCYELVHGTGEPKGDCPYCRTKQSGKTFTEESFEAHLGIYLETNTSPLFNNKGEVIGAVHVLRDISARKQMDQQLMLTDRLASIGELASGIAHELNNPLTSVIGFSQLLSEKDIDDDIKEDLNLINSEAQRAASIVKNLLTFARKHNPVKQLTKINDVIETVLKLRAYEQKVHNITVVKNFGNNLPEIMTDYFQMQQVFINLIINAEFFMTEEHNRGTLTITTERIRNNVRLSFADDGQGISPENLKKLFNPFFTTKEVGKGTGLGLSICHGIVAGHGGRIYATSECGKGATFIVELPISSLE